MMLRARSYSTLNRSIARGITYALRDSNRKKYSNAYNKQNTNNNTTIPKITPVSGSDLAIVVGVIGILIVLPFVWSWVWLIYAIVAFVMIFGG